MADLNDGRLDLRRSRPRFIAFGVAAALLFVALSGRLFQLQVVNGEEYASRAAADGSAPGITGGGAVPTMVRLGVGAEPGGETGTLGGFGIDSLESSNKDNQPGGAPDGGRE